MEPDFEGLFGSERPDGVPQPNRASASSSKRRKKSENKTGSLGPISFEEVVAWPEQVEADMRRNYPGLYAVGADKFTRPLVVTTHYSGMGCPELALLMLVAQARKGEPRDASNVNLYSACEVNPTARAMLLNRSDDSCAAGPCHVFGDITSRVPVDDLAVLKQIEFDSLDKLESMKGDQGLTKEEKAAKRQEWGAQMVAAMCAKLSSCVFVEQDWCYKHNCMRRLKPQLPPGAEHAEVTGTTCVAWSTMKSADADAGKWLHPSTLPCLV